MSESLIGLAATGNLPDWAEVGPTRYEHMRRVAALLAEWSAALGHDAEETTRWSALGWLHDALRDAPAERLLPWVEDPFRDLPESFLHGPAAAHRLSREGVTDDELLDAIRYHTLGHAHMGRLGRALIAADFLEPGRTTLVDWRRQRRQRMPNEFDGVFADVIGARLELGLERNEPLRPEMVALWNNLVQDETPDQR